MHQQADICKRYLCDGINASRGSKGMALKGKAACAWLTSSITASELWNFVHTEWGVES